MIGVSGLILLVSVFAPEYSWELSALSFYMAGLSMAPLVVEGERRLVAILLLTLAALIVVAVDEGLWPLATAAGALAVVLAASEHPIKAPPLLAAPVALTVALSPGEYKWLLLSAYLLLLGASLAVAVKRVHPSLLSISSVAPILTPGYPAMIAAFTATLVYLAVSKAVERPTCPFRVDEATLAAGSVLSLVGYLAWLSGVEMIGKPLLLSGAMILVAANLAPYKPYIYNLGREVKVRSSK